MFPYYDIVIIGSGIAGLYSAYNIKKINPEKSFVIIERDRKEWIGGRIGNDTFYGTRVVVGAGVGRKKKDILLVKLLKELHINTKENDVCINYAKTIPTVINVKDTIKFLRYIYEKQNPKPVTTFEQFAKKELGLEKYRLFTTSAGYTDYEKEDVYETLYNYGMEDNIPGWKYLSVPWKELVLKLCDVIGMKNIKYKTNALHIQKIQDNPTLFEIKTSKTTYLCNKIIVATNINGIKNLVPGANNPTSLYQQIHGQPFVRVYAKFPEKSAAIMKEYVPCQTIVPGPLHKIIPMSEDVYMIAYTDNAGALYVKEHLENNIKNREFFERLLELSLGITKNTIHITAIKDYYWPIGTHYYDTLNGYNNRKEFLIDAQHPEKNILVVGEVVSMDQGWTEGALESVHSVLTKKWINHE